MAIKHDVHNQEVNGINFRDVLALNLVIFAVGLIISMMGYPIVMMILCLFTVVTWNTIPHIQKTYVLGDDDGN